ncbi:hypothetical protein [Nocardia huaxiensis]|uniref:Secreted protein n=1 Tax=Nocardia huaxiensis TaxID=2755382 RepID=A0A7D6VBH1_9NOCA|nr:hypothetical protein [Nocardia huaxiensis]QLY28235.1 hypothetical protein H0264_22900 [Nocardia huaxiensis]UFS98330.1 hypothetical protein LPY97_10735 [Nocardia huaxiensis]
MSGAVISAIIAVVVIVVAIVLAMALRPRMRSRKLKNRFGPEYDRTVQQTHNRRMAEEELAEREKRHQQLELRELSEDERQRYTTQWTQVQEQFIDDPAQALNAADRLLTTVMADRGYPTESYRQQLADLSVEHARPLEQYRTAHDIAGRAGRGEATTEDMRAAIVHYRTLFVDLLDGRHAQHTAHNK